MRATIASSSSSTPSPDLAEICSTSSSPSSSWISPATRSGSAPGRSILLSAGISSRPGVDRQVGVGDGLRLHALAGVDEQQGAVAGGQRARDLVGEVDVARGVDQVEAVELAVLGGVLHADRLGLDRDAALALEVHGVEQLRAVVARIDRAGDLEDAIGQRRLPMVDVGDDREVADVGCGRCHADLRVWRSVETVDRTRGRQRHRGCEGRLRGLHRARRGSACSRTPTPEIVFSPVTGDHAGRTGALPRPRRPAPVLPRRRRGLGRAAHRAGRVPPDRRHDPGHRPGQRPLPGPHRRRLDRMDLAPDATAWSPTPACTPRPPTRWRRSRAGAREVSLRARRRLSRTTAPR